jgi:RNA polymerase-binding transcription factor DksA
MSINTQVYKTLLETERDELKNDLGSMAKFDPSTGNYQALPADDENEADESDIATRDEEFEEDSALTDTFSLQLKDINDALKKIEDGLYGKCEVCGADIEEDRLTANPSARTCTVHMNS